MEYVTIAAAFLSQFNAAQLMAGALGVVICTYSLIGWAKMFANGFQEDPAEQAQRDAFAEEYFKRYKVYPPK
jgi:hypothetical protein